MSDSRKGALPQPETVATLNAAPNRDISDTELSAVDGGVDVPSVAGTTRRPIDSWKLRPKLPPFWEG